MLFFLISYRECHSGDTAKAAADWEWKERVSLAVARLRSLLSLRWNSGREVAFESPALLVSFICSEQAFPGRLASSTVLGEITTFFPFRPQNGAALLFQHKSRGETSIRRITRGWTSQCLGQTSPFVCRAVALPFCVLGLNRFIRAP